MAQYRKLNRPNASRLKLEIPKDEYSMRYKPYHMNSNKIDLHTVKEKNMIHGLIKEETSYIDISDPELAKWTRSPNARNSSDTGKMENIVKRAIENEPKKIVTFSEEVEII